MNQHSCDRDFASKLYDECDCLDRKVGSIGLGGEEGLLEEYWGKSE
jgi:hypothetical protein